MLPTHRNDRRKAPLAGGAFLFLFALGLLGFAHQPAQAQSKTSGSKGPSAKASSKKQPAKRTPTRRRARAQTAPTAERIAEIQFALAEAGHYTSEPTGKWDSATIAALKSFQAEKGLSVNGKLSARTLQMLGLGSVTAGLAPPRKPVAADSGSSQ